MSTRYVWEKWNVVQTYKYKESRTSVNQRVYSSTWPLREGISVNENTGTISLTGGNKSDWGYLNYGGSYYYAFHNGATSDTVMIYTLYTKITAERYLFSTTKGSTSYGNISSTSSGAYPSNNYSGSYWYVSKGSDTIDPAAVSYDALTVIAGKTVTATISPSSGIINGGTITYSVETNTDEAGWEPYIETTATTFTFDIPKDAVSWRVRVKARDNMGFSSSTYVYGNNAADEPTTVIHPSVFAVIPEDKNLGFVSTSSIVSYLVTTDDNVDYTISVSLNGTNIYNATESPKARTLTIPDENWEALSLEQVHTVVMLISQGDK